MRWFKVWMVVCVAAFVISADGSVSGEESTPPDLASLAESMGVMRDRIAQLEDEVAKLREVGAVPANAILAVRSAECPSGWTRYEKANGRVIVGAGKGEGLTYREVLEEGGRESYELNVSQLPSHSHLNRFMGMLDGRPLQWGPGSHPIPTMVPNERSLKINFPKGETEKTGNSDPYDVMPPFLALQFCEKLF